MIATSPGAPTCRVPILGTMIFAGLIVAIATICSSVKPSPMNFDMTRGGKACQACCRKRRGGPMRSYRARIRPGSPLRRPCNRNCRRHGNIRILTDRLGAGVHLREIDVVELRDGKRRQPDIGDMHEGVESGAGLPDNEAPEGGEIVCTGVTRRNTCRGALIDHGFVGRKADG